MLKAEAKKKVVEKYRVHDSDTGSSSVQIAVLSEEINRLSEHLKTHKKDNHSRRGLLKMVSKRKSLLDYLSRQNKEQYLALTIKLGLKSKA
ncbi:MAG: 30S ribosomal protein S15 [Patescibacteria group bacterium]